MMLSIGLYGLLCAKYCYFGVADRADKAKGMYEKLLSHPNPRVSKKARQFMFSFQVTLTPTKVSYLMISFQFSAQGT